MATIIDCDQHLFETRNLWVDYADPKDRDTALRMIDDDAGHVWVTWKGHKIRLADATIPGETSEAGERLQRALAKLPPLIPYDEALPQSYWDPSLRLADLDRMGIDEAFGFPNYALDWERELADDLHATKVNMGAWNRWAIEVAQEGKGRLHPVMHVTLRDLDWLDQQLADASAAGIRLAMFGPALVDGHPLSHPDLDRAWSSFIEHKITPVFHVANIERPFRDQWYEPDPSPINPVLCSVFIWVPAALAISDLVLNGVFDRFPQLRLGVVELSSVWLPMYLNYLDGAVNFVSRLHGGEYPKLELTASEYVKRQVRFAAFSYEYPKSLIPWVGDLFMCCSDYPHSEGSAHPLDDYREKEEGTEPSAVPGLFGDNAAWLLGRTSAASAGAH